MNTNEKCLLNYLSYLNPSFEGTDCLIKFYPTIKEKLNFIILNPDVFDIIDEMEFSNYNSLYE